MRAARRYGAVLLAVVGVSGCATNWQHSSITDVELANRQLKMDDAYCRLRKRGQAEDACKKLGWSLPDSPQAFAELLGNARQEVENWEQRSNDSRAEQFRLDREKKDAETAFSQALKEVQALQRQPLNVACTIAPRRGTTCLTVSSSSTSAPRLWVSGLSAFNRYGCAYVTTA